MIDPALAFNVGAVVVAAIIGAAAGGRRGVSLMARKADNEIDRLVAAQSSRIEILEHENTRLSERVMDLERQVQVLREELELEKRITARLSS